jgi:hypothetical protein
MEEVLPLMDKYIVAQEDHKLKTMKRQMIEALHDGIIDLDKDNTSLFNDTDKDALFQSVLLKFSNTINELRLELQHLDKETNLHDNNDDNNNDNDTTNITINDKENNTSTTNTNSNTYQSSATMNIYKKSNNTDTNNVIKGLQTEIRQMRSILNAINNDTNNTNNIITKKNEKLQSLLSDLNILDTVEASSSSSSTSTSNDSKKLPTTIDDTAALLSLQKSNEIHNEKMSDLLALNNDANDLLSGIKSLMNIDDIIIDIDINNYMKMIVTLDHMKVAIVLDYDTKKVRDITIIESSQVKIDVNRILDDVTMMPTPQDLRYCLFALSSCQESQMHLQKHIAALRKKCIIKQVNTNTVQITLGSGISVTLLIHECYPEIPGAVYIDSIIGIGGWDQDELANMKANINASCFNNIVDVFNFLS